MAFKARAIPEVRMTASYDYQVNKVMREIILELQQDRVAQQGITPLPATASLTDVINKVNEIIGKLNG